MEICAYDVQRSFVEAERFVSTDVSTEYTGEPILGSRGHKTQLTA
jgi:hypothetical protein